MDKKLIINGQEWVPHVFRNMSFWHQWLSNYGHFYNFKNWGMKAPIRMLCITIDGIHTHVFQTPENKKEINENIIELFSKKEKIIALEKKYKKLAGNVIAAMDKCKKSFTIKNWRNFEKEYSIFGYGLSLSTTIGIVGSEKLTQKLKEIGIDELQIPNIISAITYPKNHTPLFISTLDMLKIGAKIQSGILKENKIDKELKKWLEKHGYIPVNFCNDPWLINDAKNQLADILKRNCKEEIKELEKSHKSKITNANKKIKELKDKEVALLAFCLQQTTYLNEYRKNIFSYVSLKMRPLFVKIAKMAGSETWRDCYYFLPEEILEILNGRLKSIKDILEKRRIVAYYMDDKTGDELFLNSDDTKVLINFINEKPAEQKSGNFVKQEIRGFPANSGKVTGIAKIVLSSKDFSKLLPGEILVAIMTSVDFVSIMEKALAFVTDEGGITCHASIVARELKKPCIIGTKNATKILKDGDLVEVDANKGIVKILKNK